MIIFYQVVLIFPQGADNDESKYIDYEKYHNPKDNIGKQTLEGAFQSKPIQQFIVGSCSHKHYAITRFYEEKYEIPVYTLSTAADEGKISVFALCKVTGDLLDVKMLGNKHNFTSDGFREQYQIENIGKDVKQHHLNADNWKTILIYKNLHQSKLIVTPANYTYNAELPAESNATLRGTTAKILDGINANYNAIQVKKIR